MGLGQKQNGFLLSKKHDKYVTQVDHPFDQKTANSHKHRNPKGYSKDPENQLMSPKDVRRSGGLAYFIEIEEKSRDIQVESVEKGMSSLIVTDCEGKNQPRRPTCPPGFSDIPQVLINNIDSDQDKTSNDQPKIPTVVEGLQDIIENWRGEYAMGSVGQYSWF